MRYGVYEHGHRLASKDRALLLIYLVVKKVSEQCGFTCRPYVALGTSFHSDADCSVTNTHRTDSAQPRILALNFTFDSEHCCLYACKLLTGGQSVRIRTNLKPALCNIH